MRAYNLKYTSRARRDLEKLPEKIASACVSFIRSTIVENPYRVGKSLESSWEGHYTARRAEYRIIDTIDDNTVTVEVVTIKHRAQAYRPR